MSRGLPPTSPLSIDEPSRLREAGETSSLERALLGAGASYRTSPHARAKVLAGLGIAGSATLLGGSAAASSVASAAKLTWTKVLLGVSLVGATAVPVGYYAFHRQTPTAGAESSVATAPAAPEATAAPTPAAGSTQEPTAARRAAMLTDELEAIDHARLALAGGDARRAIDELDSYDRRFPGGRLQIEAEVMRIDAFAKLGRKDVARQRAEAFLKRHPNSVLATRVRAHLND
jgi:hypothetical protein